MIHPTSIVSPGAQLGESVLVGPFCTIGDNVTLGDGCILDSHVVIEGPSAIGPANRFFPFCVIGTQPQDLKFAGEESVLTIGSHNVFREYVNIHRGTRGGGGQTRIGAHNFLMTAVHVAHDCIIGDHVIMANAATLAGHVIIEDHATVGAYSGIHQFCRVGRHGYVGGYTVVTKDVLPYSKTVSDRNTKAYGVNAIGLERKGFSSEQIAAIKAAFRLLLQSNLNTTQAVAAIREAGLGAEADMIIRFIETSNRGVVK
jgi:UDP-N-acetylglucosamine acyltransferase